MSTSVIPLIIDSDALSRWHTSRKALSVMENKIQTLRKCIHRVARISDVCSVVMHDKCVDRFAALWQARNRRTRVMMARKGAI